MPSSSRRHHGKRQHVHQRRDQTPTTKSSTNQSEPRVIPGFYWDSEKKRYFKIQKNHHVQAGASYTTSDVKQRLETDAKVQKEKDATNRNKARIKRNPLFHSSLPAALIWREFAYAKPCPSIKSSTLKHAITHLHGVVGSNLEPKLLLDADPDATLYNRRPVSQNITFKYDPHLHVIYLHTGASRPHPSNHVVLLDECCPFQYLREPPSFGLGGHTIQVRTPIREIISLRSRQKLRMPLERISMSLAPGLFAVASETAVDAILMDVSRKPRPERPPGIREGRDWGYSQSFDARELDQYNYNGPGQLDEVSIRNIRNISFEPKSANLWITSNNTLCKMIFQQYDMKYFLQHYDVKYAGPILTFDRLRSDILCLEFLSESILSVGLRDGKIKLYDVRQPTPRHSAAIVVQHPGAVTNIARTASSPRYLVANGIPDCMYMYDTRMVKPEQLRNLSAAPVLRYDHRNSKYPAFDLGFDASAELDLIAATQSDGSIRLFSMSSGETLQDLSVKQDSQELEYFKSLQIVQDDDGYCRILAARDSKIYDFASHYDLGASKEALTRPLQWLRV